MDRGAWWATVREVAKSWTRLSDFTFHFQAYLRVEWELMRGALNVILISGKTSS